MTRNFTLSVILSLCASLFCKFASAITYVDNGTSTTYSLNSGDSLFIATGTYTGNINSFPSGAKITVSDMAIFNPSTFPNTSGNSAAGIMYVYGTFTFTSSLITNTNFTIHNYGTVNLGSVTIKGKDQVWTNHYGGTINFAGDVVMNGAVGDDNNAFINYETINCNGNFQMNTGSVFTNYKDFTASGNVKVNGGTLRNEGNLVVTGNILMNNGASVIRNYCRMETSGGLTNTSGNFYNYSYVWARNSDIVNSSAIINVLIGGATPPIIHGRNYTHSTGGTMTGPALLYFYGTTTMTGGTLGVNGATADTIKMNDITRISPTQILDVQSGGTRYPNVIYNAWGAPDSLRVYLTGCSVEIFLEIPLAINWNFFEVNLTNNIPLLNWSAEFVQSTVFEIQRSYDGRNFSTIDDLPYEVGQSGYEYKDRLVNTQAPIVYYRIKSIELGGVEKYTQTRTVKFSNKPGSIHTAPNPFTNNFIINYRAAGREAITVRILNVSGQQMFVKNLEVNDGNNDINITDAAQLAKGIYVVQVSKGYNIISSSKIIKQ